LLDIVEPVDAIRNPCINWLEGVLENAARWSEQSLRGNQFAAYLQLEAEVWSSVYVWHNDRPVGSKGLKSWTAGRTV
jgi:hypothetical protein